MAETTENYTDHIQALIAAGGVRREIYEKMNCSTETFVFANDNKASQNFTMRNKAVETMNAMNTGAILGSVPCPSGSARQKRMIRRLADITDLYTGEAEFYRERGG